MYYTHINRNTIDSNRKRGEEVPPIRIQKGKNGEVTYCREAILPAGSRLVYSPQPILSCGARLVITSDEMPEVIE